MDEIDFEHIEECTENVREIKALYEAGIKSGSEFILDPRRQISSVPSISTRASKLLNEEGRFTLRDFEGCYYPDVYDRVGYSAGKNLLLAIRLAGVAPLFDRPNLSDDGWKDFLIDMIQQGIVSWEDVAVAVCGELNPPQVGTQVANAVKHNYPQGMR